ncbi:hypothetical protein [Streptomyces sp. C10-9-1]|uniref:hypothetical protein n=1 Tax=Streptomyces sp. C10-9-1 TaxID=1859285 RepID=UPI003F49D7B3
MTDEIDELMAAIGLVPKRKTSRPARPRTGADAAREIAARHEEQYGAVWDGRHAAALAAARQNQEGQNTP